MEHAWAAEASEVEATEGPSIHSPDPEPNPNPSQAHRVLTLALARPPDWAVAADLGGRRL